MSMTDGGATDSPVGGGGAKEPELWPKAPGRLGVAGRVTGLTGKLPI